MKTKMKNLVLLSIVFFMMACGKSTVNPIQKTDLYVYLDYTEGQNYHSIEDDIDSYLELMEVTEESPSNFGTVKIFPLYDIGSTPSATVKLKAGKSKMEANKYLRDQEVDKFKVRLMEKVEGMNAEYSNKRLKKSHIFQPISKGLTKLEKSSADRKIVLIYSDMLENSDLANFHRGIKTEKLMEVFNGATSIEDLSDFEIYIVHPINKENDNKIQKGGEFWKEFFIKKGLDGDMYHFDTGIEI